MEYRSVKASPLSRLGASLIDVIVVLLLFIFSMNFVFAPLISTTKSYQEVYTSYVDGLTETKLFNKDENGKLNSNLNSFELDKDDEYYQTLINFYESNDFIDEEKEFLLRREETNFYNNNILNQDVSYNDLYQYYKEENSNAIDVLLEKNSEFDSLYKKMQSYHYLVLILSLELGILIAYILFPLIFKDGQTLGKKMFNIKVVLAKNITLSPSKIVILLRELIFVCFSYEIPVLIYSISSLKFQYFDLPLAIYLIPLILEMIFIFISPCNNSLHDTIMNTTVIDARKEVEYRENEQII